jgi:hypothetical protein
MKRLVDIWLGAAMANGAWQSAPQQAMDASG